jgi:cyanophycinase-like exopeptidase
MSEPIQQPIVLLADSQLLFWSGPDGPFLAGLVRQHSPAPRDMAAAYIGASNGDQPEFYALFVEAMAAAGVTNCRHIPGAPTPDDLAFLDRAGLILLSGGDTALGWETISGNGVKSRVVERYGEGALLIGVSAGAVQLGLKGWRGEQPEPADLFDTARLVPLLIDVHQPAGWQRLGALIQYFGPDSGMRGLGIPAGGGALFFPDGTLEPVRHPLAELRWGEDGPQQSLLWPPA